MASGPAQGFLAISTAICNIRRKRESGDPERRDSKGKALFSSWRRRSVCAEPMTTKNARIEIHNAVFGRSALATLDRARCTIVRLTPRIINIPQRSANLGAQMIDLEAHDVLSPARAFGIYRVVLSRMSSSPAAGLYQNLHGSSSHTVAPMDPGRSLDSPCIGFLAALPSCSRPGKSEVRTEHICMRPVPGTLLANLTAILIRTLRMLSSVPCGVIGSTSAFQPRSPT